MPARRSPRRAAAQARPCGVSAAAVESGVGRAHCRAAADAAQDGTEIIGADGGSGDGTAALAEARGARVLRSDAGRGAQLVAGAAAARGRWLLFLHADTTLSEGWWDAAKGFMKAPATDETRAAYFLYALDVDSPAARRPAALVVSRCLLLLLPHRDQGLLLSREFHVALRSFRPLPTL